MNLVSKSNPLASSQPVRYGNVELNDYQGVNPSTIPKLRIITHDPSFEETLRHIPTERHLYFYDGILDELLENVQILDSEIHLVFQQQTWKYPPSIEVILDTYSTAVVDYNIANLSASDRSWIVRRVVKQAIEASRIAQIAGNSIELYNLCDRFGELSDYYIKLEEDNRLISFSAFDWRWYPTWQFDFERGRVHDAVSAVLEYNSTIDCSDIEKLLYWAIRPCEKLGRKAPAEWIADNGDIDALLNSLRNTDSTEYKDTTIKPFPQTPTQLFIPKRKDVNSSSSLPLHNTVLDKGIEALENKIITVSENDPFLRHQIFSIIQVTNRIDPLLPSRESEIHLHLAGREYASAFIRGYPMYGQLLRELIAQKSKFAEIPESTCLWLGLAIAEKISTLASLITVIGPRISLKELEQKLQITRTEIHELEDSNSLISFSSDDYYWFPKWQFDLEAKHIRPIAAKLIQTIKSKDTALGDYEIASWATSVSNDGLDRNTPADWIEDPNREPELVMDAAKILLRAMNV